MKEAFKKLPLDKKIKYTFLMIILIVIFFPAIIMLLGMVASAKAESRQNLKYKKVIKQGLFWDTTYLIEK